MSLPVLMMVEVPVGRRGVRGESRVELNIRIECQFGWHAKSCHYSIEVCGSECQQSAAYQLSRSLNPKTRPHAGINLKRIIKTLL